MPETNVATLAGNGEGSPPEQGQQDVDYWYSLIDEDPAAEFVDVVPRTMQGWRQRGEGPPFVRISSRESRFDGVKLSR